MEKAEKGHKKVYMWSMVDRIGNTALTFTANIVLARLLTTSDFGLLSMVAIFTAIAQNVSGCGMSDGLIHKLNPTQRDYSTVFVFNAVFGIFFALVAIALARPIANLFHQDALVNIMWAIGVCFFFQSLTFTQETRMRKELRMKELAIVRLSATFCAVSLGIFLAWKYHTYWGLVSCRVFIFFFLFVFYVIVSRWIPKARFYADSFKEMFSYGLPLMFAYLLNQISRNINNAVLGRISPAASGVYSQAQKMEDVPFGITETVFNWPFFAVLANEPDPQQRRVLARSMFVKILFLNLSVASLLMLMSAPGFLMLFGSKWVEAIPLFRILLVFGVCSAVKYFFQTILKVRGATVHITLLTLGEVLMQLGLLCIAFSHGIIYIAWSQVIASALFVAVYGVMYMRMTQSGIATMLKAIVQSLLLPASSFVLTAIAYKWYNGLIPPYANAFATLGIFASVFIASGELFRPACYKEVKQLVIKMIRR